MKEETKLWLSKVIIKLEESLSYIEQDEGNSGLNEREKKGLIVEKEEILTQLGNAKKCFHWVNSIKT